ncbi:hypothetical protein XELAEV_18041868mg [Xenopus laevis]|nr:hypothetical protein XELAEV_18041868mg [Xenopus laevis]
MGTVIWFYLSCFCMTAEAITRTYYIAAVERYWDYKNSSLLYTEHRSQTAKSPDSVLYKKAVYVEYTDASFSQEKPQLEWTGLLGPTIRAETYDTVVIHFKNLASIAYNIHGVGVSYGKSSEGVPYEDGTSPSENVGDAVPPGEMYRYIWEIPLSYGPTTSDPSCVTSAYYSHNNSSYDTNTGLVGALLICKPGSLSADGSQFGVQERVLLFAVFDERKSHYTMTTDEEPQHTINGYANSSLPVLVICRQKPLSLHVIGFGPHTEVHTISLEGHSFVVRGHRIISLPVTAFTFITASIQPGEKGAYNLSCQNPLHPAGGMAALVMVQDCAEEFVKQMRFLDMHDDYEEEDDYESDFIEQPDYVSPNYVRSHGKLRPVIWKHYIAAVEVNWDYVPSKDDESSSYIKAVFQEFTDARFLHPKVSELDGTGILGPVLRGEVGDEIQIVFKNLASRPYNMHPQGLGSVSTKEPYMTGEQLKEYPIYPNETITYIWRVTQGDAPLSSDPRCLTRLYSSSLNPQKDLASGLFGPLLICTKQTLDQRGIQIITDKEHILVYFVFDESLSWYQEKNFKGRNGRSGKQTSNIKPMKPSLLYTVNGVDSLHLSVCVNEVSIWHILNLGPDLLSIRFGGNTFSTDSGYQDTLTLFPVKGETINMVMEKAGHWTIVPLDFSLEEQDMTVWLSVSKCGSDQDEFYQDEFEDFTEELLHDISPPSPRGIHHNLPKLVNIKQRGTKEKEALESKNLEDENSGVFASLSELSEETPQTDQAAPWILTSGEIPEDISDELSSAKRTNILSNQEEKNEYLGSSNTTVPVGHGTKEDEFYENYDDLEDIDMYDDVNEDQDPRSISGVLRTYFIAAVEVMWDYGSETSPYFTFKKHRGSHGFPLYKKVVFREYLNIDFTEPSLQGERDAHLGLLGPHIRAEINDEIIIHFKNMASRPYNFYSNILSMQKDSKESVSPQGTRTYTGRVNEQFGPTEPGVQCRVWPYSSNVNSERDLHSGLLGPFHVCRRQVLSRHFNRQISVRDFSLMFMKTDESQSWYFSENLQKQCPPGCEEGGATLASCPLACTKSLLLEFQELHMFHAINGYTADSLPGLIMPLGQRIRWHLLSIGSSNILPIHFHGNILTDHGKEEHRLSLLNLYPGVSVSLEMAPQSIGLWRVETEAEYPVSEMMALYLVYDPQCRQPLGLSSGKIKDSQISASGHYGTWMPSLARLHNSGSINAWSVKNENSWIQVDLHMPTLIHSIQTQGARQRLLSLYVSQFIVSYSLNGKSWIPYQGNASSNQMVFFGNIDSSSVQENIFDPPIIARLIRLHPTHTKTRAALRMEFGGCDITSCSLPLGLQSGSLPDHQISATSYLNSIFSSWIPALARLNQPGRVNAWRPQVDATGQWLQVDFGRRMKVTGLIVQGARSVFTPMFISQFSLSYSNDVHTWEILSEPNGHRKIFPGNQDPETPFSITLDTPIITRFLRLHPESWKGGIALRMEVLGCENN